MKVHVKYKVGLQAFEKLKPYNVRRPYYAHASII
jgi:hypothetical protein